MKMNLKIIVLAIASVGLSKASDTEFNLKPTHSGAVAGFTERLTENLSGGVHVFIDPNPKVVAVRASAQWTVTPKATVETQIIVSPDLNPKATQGSIKLTLTE
jgi:hypothetical protein